MSVTRKRISVLFVPALFWLAGFLPAGAQDEVRLAPGDTVVFSVIGDPDLGRQAIVGADGAIYLPFVGKVVAAGLTIDQLRENVYASLSNRPYRVGVAGGEDVWRQVQDYELYLDIAEYRPIYVTGDVRNPGEVRYRPGITVRQALAIAGGVGRPVEDDSEWEVLKLLGERAVLGAEIRTQDAEIERLEADLDAVIARREAAGKGEAGPAEPSSAGGAPTALEDVARRWLDARADLRLLTDTGNDLVLDQMENRLEVLEELQQASEETLSLEEKEFARTEQLAERGVVPASTIADARRVLLQSSSRTLETAGEVLRLKLDIARLSEQMKANLTNEQVQLLEAIANSTSKLRRLESEVRSVDTRLAALGAMPADDQSTTEMQIFRADSESGSGEPAMPNMTMAPGDVLEVTISTAHEEVPPASN